MKRLALVLALVVSLMLPSGVFGARHTGSISISDNTVKIGQTVEFTYSVTGDLAKNEAVEIYLACYYGANYWETEWPEDSELVSVNSTTLRWIADIPNLKNTANCYAYLFINTQKSIGNNQYNRLDVEDFTVYN